MKNKEKEDDGFCCVSAAIRDDCYRCIRNSLCRHRYDSVEISSCAAITLWTPAAVMFIGFIACCRSHSCSAVYPCHPLFMSPLLSPIILWNGGFFWHRLCRIISMVSFWISPSSSFLSFLVSFLYWNYHRIFGWQIVVVKYLKIVFSADLIFEI